MIDTYMKENGPNQPRWSTEVIFPINENNAAVEKQLEEESYFQLWARLLTGWAFVMILAFITGTVLASFCTGIYVATSFFLDFLK